MRAQPASHLRHHHPRRRCHRWRRHRKQRGGESDCDSVGEFTLYADEVNKACCGGVASPSCVGGQPTECTGGCEAVLMPMARVCANFLERMGLNTTVAYATNLCHPQQVAGQSGH